jgi:hypothetical protein
MMSSKHWFRSIAAVCAMVLVGCAVDDPGPFAVEGPVMQQELFARYAAIGNSITAGIQSGGINDSTQLLSYPKLLADRAGTIFELPLFRYPGCPPPFVDALGQGGRVGEVPAGTCQLREQPFRPVQNLAVPGARLADALDPFSDPDPGSSFNRIQTLVLGGRSQVSAAEEFQPTLLTVWIGNNDVLAPALSGRLEGMPDVADFDRLVENLTARLAAIPTLLEVVMIGVIDTNLVPLLQPGAYYWLSRGADGRFLGKEVAASCAPFDAEGRANPAAGNLVSFEMAANPAFPRIECDENAFPEGDPRRGALLLTVTEQQALAARVAAFNHVIAARAEENGWIFLDPNIRLLELAGIRDELGRYPYLRRCQALPATLPTGDAAAIQAAVLTSCPVPDSGPTAPFAAANFFGELMSFDGVHPGTAGHREVANLVIDVLNARHGLGIPAVGADD